MPRPIGRGHTAALAASAGLLIAITLLSLIAGGGSAHAGSGPTVADRFAAFRRAPSTQDAVPGPAGPNPGVETRRLDTADPSWDEWAQVDGNLICVASFGADRQPYQQSPPRACAPKDAVASANDPLVLVTQRDNDYRATGLVPDGVTAIQINYFDGSSEAVTIRNNGFHLHLRAQFMNLTYWDDAGSHTTEPASL